MVTLLCAVMMLALFSSRSVNAQETPNSYTVAPGDSLSAIAGAFGVPLDALIELNQIADPAYIEVGQILIIPNPDGSLPPSAIPTTTTPARPGETIAAFAARYGIDATLLAAINEEAVDTRLFPGQPVAVPRDQVGQEPLRFGAVVAAKMPDAVTQGRTAVMEVTTDRPVALEVFWNELPVPLTAVDGAPERQFAFVPAPALIQPSIYPLTIRYTTGRGIPVSRTWPVVVAPGNYGSQAIIVADEKVDLLAPEVSDAELAEVTAVWSEVSPMLHWRGRFARPVGEEFATTSAFGIRRAYGGGEINGYHAGQDFGAPVGAAVTAPAPGRVALARPLAVRGNAVLVDHGRGVFTGYWHLNELKVVEGQELAAGDLIGLVGTTGLSTGNHLHWELRIYGIAVDPMQFLTEALVPQIEGDGP